MGSGISKKQCDSSSGSKKKGKQGKEKHQLIKCLSGHSGGINVLRLSPDGKTLVTGSEDKTGRLWDTKTEECVGILNGHEMYITDLCVSERYIFTGSADKTVRKWNLESGACIKLFRGHTSGVNRVICSGDLVFSSSYDRTVRCWHADTGEICRVFRGHKLSVTPLLLVSDTNRGPSFAVDIDNNDDILVSGSADTTAKTWGLNGNDCLVTFKGHAGAITCLAVDGNGKYLFTGSADSTVRSWDLLTGAPQKVFKGHQSIIIEIQVVNRLMYSCSADHTARCWVVEFGDCTRIYKGHKHTISCLRFVDGLLFSCGGDGNARVFESKSGSCKRLYKGPCSAANCMLNVLLNYCYGHIIQYNAVHKFVTVLDNSLTLWSERVNSAPVHAGKLFVGYYDGCLRIWDASHLRDDDDDVYSNNKSNGVKK